MRRSVRGVRLKYLMRQGEFPSGNPRFYFRRSGKLTAMPDAATDSPKFMRAYTDALEASGDHSPRIVRATGSIGAGVRAYLASDRYFALAASTRGVWRRGCDRIDGAYGMARLADLRPQHIRKDLAQFKPHPANNQLRIWRSMCAFWLEAGLIEADPAREVRMKATPKSEGHAPWTQGDVAAFRKQWATDTQERLAFELMYRTCAAIGDAVKLGPGNVRDGWLSYARNKTSTPSIVPMTPENAPGWFAFNHDLDVCIASAPRHMTFMSTKFGASRSPKAAAQWFSRACKKAGVEKTAHGIRKFRAAQFRENGSTVDQRQAILGHESEEMAAHYARSADLRKIISGTESANFPNQCANSDKKAN